MNVRSAGMFNHASRVRFGDNNQNEAKQPQSTQPQNAQNYENPISRKKEKALATLSVLGGSAVLGAVVAGLASTLKIGKKASLLVGGITAAVVAGITLPSKRYNAAVNAFAKEKEMDIFSRDKALKSTLTEEVHKEVLNPEVSLDQKLDHNLKLQTANRGSSLVIQH